MLPHTLQNFVCCLAIYRLCSRIFFGWTRLWRKIAICWSELSLDTAWNFMWTCKQTFVEKSREQRTKFAHFACITFAQYCMWCLRICFDHGEYLVDLQKGCDLLWSFIEVINGVGMLLRDRRVENNILKRILLRPQWWTLKCLRQVLHQNWLFQGRLWLCVIGSFEEECKFHFPYSFLHVQLVGLWCTWLWLSMITFVLCPGFFC